MPEIKTTREDDISNFNPEGLVLAINMNGVTALQEGIGLSDPKVISALHFAFGDDISSIAEALYKAEWPLPRCLEAAEKAGYDDTARRALRKEYLSIGLENHYS